MGKSSGKPTLAASPPEPRPELSEVERLAGRPGEITVSRLEPGAPAQAAVPATGHRVVPDLDAWDLDAAQIESQASRQTPAARRAAERAAQRASRERKGRRRLFGGRRTDP